MNMQLLGAVDVKDMMGQADELGHSLGKRTRNIYGKEIEGQDDLEQVAKLLDRHFRKAFMEEVFSLIKA